MARLVNYEQNKYGDPGVKSIQNILLRKWIEYKIEKPIRKEGEYKPEKSVLTTYRKTTEIGSKESEILTRSSPLQHLYAKYKSME